MALKNTALVCFAVAVCTQTLTPAAAQRGLTSLPRPVRIISSPEPAQYLNPYLANPLEQLENTPSHYDFNYQIHDPNTGDVKNQQEENINNSLRGSYSFVQPDGRLRVVEYFDVGTGFNAHVRYEPLSLGIHPPAVKVPVLLARSANPRLTESIADGIPAPLVTGLNGLIP